MDLCKVWRTASNLSAVKAAAFDVSSAKLQNLPTRQMFAAVLQMLADTDFSVQSEIIFCCCKVGTSAAYLCKHSEPESYTAKNPKSSKGKVSKCRNGFSSFNLIRCNGEQRLQLVATGSTTPEALERLQAAAAVAGWERFVVPPPRPSRLLLEDRSSLLPAVAAVRRPVICTATTVVVQVRPFSRHLAFLAARSEPLN